MDLHIWQQIFYLLFKMFDWKETYTTGFEMLGFDNPDKFFTDETPADQFAQQLKQIPPEMQGQVVGVLSQQLGQMAQQYAQQQQQQEMQQQAQNQVQMDMYRQHMYLMDSDKLYQFEKDQIMDILYNYRCRRKKHPKRYTAI